MAACGSTRPTDARPCRSCGAWRGIQGGGIALVFARTETKLWQELVFPVAHAVLFVAGRIRFCHADGTEGESATAPSALIAYSARDVAALENSGIEGFIVYLKPKGENK